MHSSEYDKQMIASGEWKSLFPIDQIEMSVSGEWHHRDLDAHGKGFIALYMLANGMTREDAIIALANQENIKLSDTDVPKNGNLITYTKEDIEPHPSIEQPVREIMDAVKSPRHNFAIASFLVTLSVCLSGSYVTPDSGGALGLYYIAFAKAAGGKGSYGTLPSQILAQVDTDLTHISVGGMATPQSIQALLNDFDECNLKYFESPESGEFFDNLRDARSSTFGVRAPLRSAWNSEFIRGTSTKKKADSCPDCGYPNLNLWCAMTATQARDMMIDRKTAIDGLLSRISFITTTGTSQNAMAKEKWFMSNDVVTRLKNISKSNMEQIEEGKKMDTHDNAGRTLKVRVGRKGTIGISDDAWVLAKQIETENLKKVHELSEIGQEVMASLVGRHYEKSMRVASLIAAYDCAHEPDTEWVIQTHHLEWALRWELVHIENLTEISGIASEENDHAKLKKSILMAIDSIGPSKRVAEYWVKYRDMRMTNKGALRTAKPIEIKQALLDLEESGEIMMRNDTVTGKDQRLIRRTA